VAAGKTIVTYWLIPAEPERSYFSAMIRDLAARFEAPIFEPHVTIHVTDDSNEKPGTVLQQALKDRGGFRLAVRGLNYSDEFTKTVFVQFERDAELTRLSSDLRRRSAVQNEYQLNPHLSLIYKKMSTGTKVQIANSLDLPFSEVAFDTVRAVISPAQIESRADVEAWRVVAAESFTG
jgi:2'-5' RNA ligase